jgi:hypothetical protein
MYIIYGFFLFVAVGQRPDGGSHALNARAWKEPEHLHWLKDPDTTLLLTTIIKLLPILRLWE